MNIFNRKEDEPGEKSREKRRRKNIEGKTLREKRRRNGMRRIPMYESQIFTYTINGNK